MKIFSRSPLRLLIPGLFLLLVLAGCAATGSAPAATSSESAPAPAPAAAEAAPAEAALPEFCGDASRLAPVLRFFNWADYMDEDIMTQFEAECGVKVTQ